MEYRFTNIFTSPIIDNSIDMPKDELIFKQERCVVRGDITAKSIQANTLICTGKITVDKAEAYEIEAKEIGAKEEINVKSFSNSLKANGISTKLLICSGKTVAEYIRADFATVSDLEANYLEATRIKSSGIIKAKRIKAGYIEAKEILADEIEANEVKCRDWQIQTCNVDIQRTRD